VISSACRASAGRGIEEVARLVEESSLGTAGAGLLRDRAAGAASVIRARAYFAGSRAGRSWWQANQRNPVALRAKARELAAVAPEISDVLARLADDQQAAAHPGGPDAGMAAGAGQENAAGWAGFGDFYKRAFSALTVILCGQAGLPAALGQKLIRRAMNEAFNEWEELAAADDPGEWVLGRALQLYHAQRRLGTLPEAEVPEPAGLPGQRADVRVTGALAVAASRVEALHVAGTGYVPGLAAAQGTSVANSVLGTVLTEWDADRAVTAIYSTHYRSLVRLAALLLRDVATAEEVVQDSFVAMHCGWRRLRDNEKALSYLRQSIVNRSRSVLRHRVVVDRNAPKPPPDMPSAEQGAIAQLERSAVVTALRSLPARQREALVLRYYGDLSEAQIAMTMGISRGAVRSHTARAMTSLRSVLEREAEPGHNA
jgi:RNA polymerase sigma-70 factor (sigma-E family)